MKGLILVLMLISSTTLFAITHTITCKDGAGGKVIIETPSWADKTKGTVTFYGEDLRNVLSKHCFLKENTCKEKNCYSTDATIHNFDQKTSIGIAYRRGDGHICYMIWEEGGTLLLKSWRGDYGSKWKFNKGCEDN